MTNSIIEGYNQHENNPDLWWWLFYCIRYDKNMLLFKRQVVADALTRLWVIGKKTCKWIEISLPENISKELEFKINILLEEILVINGAIAYNNFGLWKANSISDLCNLLKQECDEVYRGGIVDAFTYIGSVMPWIVKNLRIAHQQCGILSKIDLKAIDELSSFAEKSCEGLNWFVWLS